MFLKEMKDIGHVAVVAPAGPADPDKVACGVELLRSCGLTVSVMPHVFARDTALGYLAASDKERAGDLMRAYADDSVDALWCVRGGYGSARTLPLLDWELMKKRPHLPVIGYSDITALHWALDKYSAGTPVVAPMVAKMCEAAADEYNIRYLALALQNKLASPQEVAADIRWFTPPPSSSGLPLAGNLAVAASLAGTRYMPDGDGRVIILEDVNEPVYKIDRYLTQLEQNGLFAGASAVLFGQFTGEVNLEELDALLRSFAAKWQIPVGINFPFGHCFPVASLRFSHTLEIADGKIYLS